MKLTKEIIARIAAGIAGFGLVALSFAPLAHAQVFSQNQLLIPPFGSGVIVSTSTANGGKLQASSSPSVGTINGTSSSATSSLPHLSTTQLKIAALSGFLKAVSGYIQTALVDLTSDVTGLLPVANGGTASSTLSGILVGNLTNSVKTLGIGSGLTFDGSTLSASGGSSGTISTSTPLANGQVDFSTGVNTIGNDSSFFWDNTNKRLGIGTSSPWAQLSVNPNGISGPAFAIGSSTGTKLIVTNGGSVGIGTAAPTSVLHVLGDTSNDITLNLQQANTVNVGVEFSATGSNGVWNVGVDRRNTNVAAANNFYISNGATLATNPRLTISTAGNIGIGTTTPAAPLDVALVTGSASVEALRLEVTGNKAVGRGPAVNFYTPNGTGIDELSASIAGLTTGSPQSGYLSFSTANAGNPTEAMRITATGNVGIGTTSPYAKLSVSGFTTGTPGLVVDALSGFTGNLADFKLASSTLFFFRQDGVFSATGEIRSGSTAMTTTGLRLGNLVNALQLGGVQGSGSTANSATAEIDLNGISQASTPGVIQFRAGTASVNNQNEVGRFDASGNFGIGTTSPGSLLSIGNTSGINLTAATSTWNTTGGINVVNGCIAVNGACLGGGSVSSVSNSDSTLTISPTTGAVVASLNLAHANTWSALQQFNGNASSTQLTITGNTYLASAGGSVGVGTTSPWGMISINPSGVIGPEFVIGSSSATHIVVANSGNVGIGSTSPAFRLTLDRSSGVASSSILVSEYAPAATSTSQGVDCHDSNTVHISLGTGATTITLAVMYPGQTCKVIVSNPNSTAGAITWATSGSQQLYWPGGTLPTQTTTANKRDVWSFIADQMPTNSTTTPATNILGAQSANF